MWYGHVYNCPCSWIPNKVLEESGASCQQLTLKNFMDKTFFIPYWQISYKCRAALKLRKETRGERGQGWNAELSAYITF